MAIISIPTSIGGVSIPGQIGQGIKGPLAALYQNNDVPTLKYPADLATDPTKSHYVTFSVKEIVPASYTSNVGVVAQQRVVVAGNAVDIAQKEFGQFNSTEFPKTAEFANNIVEGIKDGVSITPKRFLPRAVISLYMPDTLNAQYSASWNEFELGDMASTIRNIDQVAGSAYATYKDKGVGGLTSLLSSDPAVTKLITDNKFVKAAGSAIGVDTGKLGTLLLNAQGYSVNPQVQLMFNQISLRDFGLSFTFTPKSRDESKEIDRIIKMFKYHFSPALQKGRDTSSNSMFLEAPSVFNISFNVKGSENKYLPKYGDCALTNIEVNYAPNGWASFEDGAPVQTTLSLQFKEMEIVDKDRIGKGTLR
jgi:hypothetical protein